MANRNRYRTEQKQPVQKEGNTSKDMEYQYLKLANKLEQQIIAGEYRAATGSSVTNPDLIDGRVRAIKK